MVKVHNPKDIRRTFLELTRLTCPYGYEEELYGPMLEGMGFTKVDGGYYGLFGATSTDEVVDTLFVAHLDTASQGRPEAVTVEIDDNGYAKTDGLTLLGADDKAGMTVLLYMIAHNVKGHYLFTLGEEVGRIGAKASKQLINSLGVKRCIQFDRRGLSDLVTHQMGSQGCSQEFVEALRQELIVNHVHGMEPSTEGLYTDNYEFFDIVPENINISIGYDNAHTRDEVQDLVFLEWMCQAAVKIRWHALPVKRTPVSPVNMQVPFEIYRPDIVQAYDLWEQVVEGYVGYQEVYKWVYEHPEKAARFISNFIDRDSEEALECALEIL